jgi:hypothetical protein
LAVADAEVDEPEDGVDVPVVDLAERLGVTGLGAFDQHPYAGGGVGGVGPRLDGRRLRFRRLRLRGHLRSAGRVAARRVGVRGPVRVGTLALVAGALRVRDR